MTESAHHYLPDGELAVALLSESKRVPDDSLRDLVEETGGRLLKYASINLFGWEQGTQSTGTNQESRISAIKNMTHFAYAATEVLGRYGLIKIETLRNKKPEEWLRDIIEYMQKDADEKKHLRALLIEVIAANYAAAKNTGVVGYNYKALPESLRTAVEGTLIERGLIRKD